MLKDKVIAITGAAGGLGPTVVRAFHAAGTMLALAGRNEDRLVQLLDSMGASRDRRLATAVDLADEKAATAWADLVSRTFGRVHIVAHLVGGYKGGTAIGDTSSADWDFIDSMIVKTTLNVVRAFARPLAAGGWGRFLAVSSPRAQAPTARNALYAMGKSASDALVLALADELKGTGATANLIVVDSIDAPESRGSAAPKPYGKATPAEQIAATMIFLCSEDAATINGVRLPLIGRG